MRPLPSEVPGLTGRDRWQNSARWARGEEMVPNPPPPPGPTPRVRELNAHVPADGELIAVPSIGGGDQVLRLASSMSIGMWLRSGRSEEEVRAEASRLRATASELGQPNARVPHMESLTPESRLRAEQMSLATGGKQFRLGNGDIVVASAGDTCQSMELYSALNYRSSGPGSMRDSGREVIDRFRNGPLIDDDAFLRLAEQTGAEVPLSACGFLAQPGYLLPTHPVDLRALNEAAGLADEGPALLTESRLEEITSRLHQALNASPDDPEARWRLGVALMAGRGERAWGSSLLAGAVMARPDLVNRPLEAALPGLTPERARAIADSAIVRARATGVATDQVSSAALQASIGRHRAAIRALEQATRVDSANVTAIEAVLAQVRAAESAVRR